MCKTKPWKIFLALILLLQGVILIWKYDIRDIRYMFITKGEYDRRISLNYTLQKYRQEIAKTIGKLNGSKVITERKSDTPIEYRETITSPKVMNIEQNKNISDYGDGSCGNNPYKRNLQEIFKLWREIARDSNISYFLSTGTLLGAWRDGKLIPYDSDLDVMISNKDGSKLEAIREKEPFNVGDNKFHLFVQRDWKKPYSERRRFKCNGKQVPQYSDQCSFQEPFGRIIKGELHLDIYDFTIKDGYLIDLQEWPKKYLAKEVFPLQKCMFMDVMSYCPKNPPVLLHKNYGKNLAPSKICKKGSWVKE